jgi:hypothetical protein
MGYFGGSPVHFPVGPIVPWPDRAIVGTRWWINMNPWHRTGPVPTTLARSATPAGVGTLPLDAFLLAVGAQAAKALARNLRPAM